MLQLGLLTGRDRLLRGDGIEAPADAGAHIGGLLQRLIDIVDRAADRIVEADRGRRDGYAGLQRGHQVLHRRENALIGAGREAEVSRPVAGCPLKVTCTPLNAIVLPSV